MTIEEMKNRKREMGLSYEMLSQLSGIPVPTLQKIIHGKTRAPRYQTVCALERVLGQQKDPQPGRGSFPFKEPRQESCVKEPSFEYGSSSGSSADAENGTDADTGVPRYLVTPEGEYIWTMQGSYTVEDYLQLPDEKRVELIDGVIYDMGAPRYLHQEIAGEIHRQIANYILDHNGKCRVYIAPADVQLDNDNRTMVQPDVFILCDRSKSDSLRMYGAPDFVLEVISPSTKRKDFVIKTAKYMNAGVREYWILDPYREIVIIYFFEEEDTPQICGLEKPIPIRIYDGKLSIDPKHILRWIGEEKERQQVL